MGLMIGWVDRKVTARLQWRAGPPWYQNLIDILKFLLCKETLVPEGASRPVFLLMPLVALAAATLASSVIFAVNIGPGMTFIGDLVVVAYLLMIPPVALMIGGFASGNPLASLGASREMKLALSYELPFILGLCVPIIKAGYVVNMGEIIRYQSLNSPVITSISGALSFIATLFCIQAKLGMAPFDMPEAETEIIAGPCIEYSGKPLGLIKLAKAILFFAIPALSLTLYFGGVRAGLKGFFTSLFWYLVIIVLTILIKNTNPRVRIDQAMRFFWKPVTVAAACSVALALFGY
jgi:NADH-quinone oxidoreductase subunit H